MARRPIEYLFAFVLVVAIANAAATSHAYFHDDPEKDETGSLLSRKWQEPGDWITDFDEALERSQLERRPLFVIVGAEWCGWCKKLESDLDRDEAEPIWQAWTMARIDADDFPEVAERLSADGLPALRVIGFRGDVVAKHDGYLAPDKFAAWIKEQFANVDPKLQACLYGTGRPDDAQLEQLLSFLGHRTPSIRAAAIERIGDFPQSSGTKLIEILRNGSLAQRLSSIEIFGRLGAPIASLDAWHPESFNDESISEIERWLAEIEREKKPQGLEKDVAQDQVVPPADLNDRIDRYLNASESDAPALMNTVLPFRSALNGDLEQRLSAGTALPDLHRARILALQYFSNVSQATRLKAPGLLTALARPDSRIRHAAAIQLMKALTQADQDLIELLSRDDDPILREMAVRKLSDLGLLLEPANFRRLLSDQSLAVKTSVLAAIAKNSNQETNAVLCDYLKREQDEDLIVFGCNCLGKIREWDNTTQEILLDFLEHPRWRIRASAIESIGEKLQQSSRGFGNKSDKFTLNRKLSDKILESVSEEDSFVSDRAYRLLPKIMDKDNIELAATLLTDDTEKLQSLNSDDIRLPRLLENPPSILVTLARRWNRDDDVSKRVRAASLLCEISPEDLQPKLHELIASENAELRFVAYRAAAKNLMGLRKELAEQFEKEWQASDQGIIAANLGARYAAIRKKENSTIGNLASDKKVEALEAKWNQQKNGGMQEDVASPGGLLGMLFGGGSSSKKSKKKAKDLQPQEDSVPASLEDQNQVLMDKLSAIHQEYADLDKEFEAHFANDDAQGTQSLWFNSWYDPASERPEWCQLLAESIRNLRETCSDPQEQAWLEFLHLACGSTDRLDAIERDIHERIRGEIAATEQKRKPSLEFLFQWLPSPLRLELGKKVLRSDLVRASSSMERKVLYAITSIDDVSVADWLFDEYFVPESNEYLGSAPLHILHALFHPNWSWYGKEIDDPEIFQKPGYYRAITHLRNRLATESQEGKRQCLLICLAQLNRQIACEFATQELAREPARADMKNIALQVLLNDQYWISAFRAKKLLDSQDEAVLTRSLERLITACEVYHPDYLVPFGRKSDPWNSEIDVRMELALVEIYRSTSPRLEILASHSNPIIAARANWLVTILDPHRSIDSQIVQQMELIRRNELYEFIIPFVIQERTDSNAIAIYETILDRPNEYDRWQAIEWLRQLQNESINSLLEKIQKKDFELPIMESREDLR